MIRLAASRPGWALGFADEVWFSRLAQPALHAWAGAQPRLSVHSVGRDEPEKALACYGLWQPTGERMWLRFVAGRPVSAVTCAFLRWVTRRLAAEGRRVTQRRKAQVTVLTGRPATKRSHIRSPEGCHRP